MISDYRFARIKIYAHLDSDVGWRREEIEHPDWRMALRMTIRLLSRCTRGLFGSIPVNREQQVHFRFHYMPIVWREFNGEQAENPQNFVEFTCGSPHKRFVIMIQNKCLQKGGVTQRRHLIINNFRSIENDDDESL